jgi:hypothetical protein
MEGIRYPKQLLTTNPLEEDLDDQYRLLDRYNSEAKAGYLLA